MPKYKEKADIFISDFKEMKNLLFNSLKLMTLVTLEVFISQISRCVFLFWLMSIRANHVSKISESIDEFD